MVGCGRRQAGATRKDAVRIRVLKGLATIVRSKARVGLCLGLVLGLGLGSSLVGCKKTKREPFSCERYQKRMERCENYVVAAVKRRYETDVKTGDIGADEAAAQLKMFQRRIRRRVRYKNSLRRCRKLQNLRTPHHRKRFTTMKFCLGRSGCKDFGECMQGLW